MCQPRSATLLRSTRAIRSTAEGTCPFAITNRSALSGLLAAEVRLNAGYPPAMGKCVLARTERGASPELRGFPGAGDRWWDAHAMLERAFGHAAGSR